MYTNFIIYVENDLNKLTKFRMHMAFYIFSKKT